MKLVIYGMEDNSPSAWAACEAVLKDFLKRDKPDLFYTRINVGDIIEKIHVMRGKKSITLTVQPLVEEDNGRV